MENMLGGLLVIIFVSSRLSSAQYHSIKTGNFQLLQKHPNLKQCAADILHENEHVGARVSEQTGECEALPLSWGLNPTIENGYAYVKKLSAGENFEPPLKILDAAFSWTIPGVMNAGARLDVLMSIPYPNNPKRRDILQVKPTEDGKDRSITMQKVEHNGKELHTFQVKFPITAFEQITMWSLDANDEHTLIHGFQFTGKVQSEK